MLKNVTVTMDEQLLLSVRVEAAKQGKSVSKFISEEMRRRCGQKLSQREAIDRFLSGPPLRLLNDDLTAPTTDQLYE
jgi:hypothetical protein